MAILYLVSLLPVLLFIGMLVWLDSFSLIKRRYLLLAFAWGALSTFFSTTANGWAPGHLLTAPVNEEAIKGLGALFLVRTRRAAFTIDAMLYGAAIGAGFAIFENLYYISHFPDMAVGTAIVRGVGTALMHCGAVGGTAAILNWLMMRTHHAARFYVLAILPAIALHALYNSLILNPYLSLIITTAGVSGWFMLLISKSETSIGKWLEMELSSEVELLGAMYRGEFSSSKAGQYLLTVRDKFTPERFLDIYCYLQIYLELSLLSKRNLMLSENGMEIPHDDETENKTREFMALKKQIGKVGELALAPIVKRDGLWKWKLKTVGNEG